MCLSFPRFCFAVDRNTTYVGLNVSQKIHIVNWSPKLFPEVFQISSGIWHHSKCHTAFGLVLYRSTMGLFLPLPVTSAIQRWESKKERKKGSPILPSHELVWWRKLLAQYRVWWSTSPWMCTALSSSLVPFSPPCQGGGTSTLCWEDANTQSMVEKGQIKECPLKSLLVKTCKFF